LLCKNIKTKIHRTTILAVLYGCETWSLAFTEEHRLRVFTNRVLRKIFGTAKREWRRLHNQELYDLYSSPNNFWVIKSRGTRWAGHVAGMGDRQGAYMERQY